MLMVERSSKSPRILHEADCDEYGESDKQDDVENEEDLANRFEAPEAVGLLRE